MTNMPDKRKKREKREGKKKDAARIPNLPFPKNLLLLPNVHFQEKTLFGIAQQQCCISLLLLWLFCLGNYYCTAAEGFFAYLCRMRNREGGCKKFPKKKLPQKIRTIVAHPGITVFYSSAAGKFNSFFAWETGDSLFISFRCCYLSPSFLWWEQKLVSRDLAANRKTSSPDFSSPPLSSPSTDLQN